MEPVTSRVLFESLRDSGLYTAAQVAAADAALPAGVEPHAAADKLWELRVLTEFQFRKIKAGRTADILFGPYMLLDKIGEGGMGKVYRAVQARTGRMVALKTIRPHLMTNAVVLKRYQREAKAVAALDHPNIVALYDADVLQGRFYMAMEYVDGVDLARIVKLYGRPPEGGLDDWREACEYVRQACLGLQAAHDRGFVHRDIKPSNMLVFGERAIDGARGKAVVKILDMGLVRTVGDSEELSRTELTRDGTVVGTPDYMAPEQAKHSSSVDHRADLYAIGCTLFYMLRGQPPFPDGNPIDKLIRHQLDDPPDLRRLRPDVPEDVHRVVELLLKKKADDRIQTAREVAAALGRVLAGESTGLGAPDPAPTISFTPMSLEPDPPAVDLTPPSTPAAGSAQTIPVGPPTPHAVPAPPSGGVAATGPRSAAVKAPASKPVPKPAPASGVIGPANRPPSGTVAAPRPLPAPRSGAVPASPPAVPRPAPRVVPVSVPPAPVPTHAPAPPPPPPAAPVTAEAVDDEDDGPIVGRNKRSHSQLRAGKPHRRKKSGTPGWQVAAWVGGGLAVMVVVAAVAKHGGEAEKPPATQAPPPDTKPAVVAGYPHLPPAAAVLPPGTVAAVVAYPQPFWKNAASRPDGPLLAGLADLARRARFDPRQFERGTVALTARPGEYLAVGEGPFLTPEWAAGFDVLPGAAPLAVSEKIGAAKLYSLGGTKGNPFLGPKAGGPNPRFAGVLPGKWLAVSDDRRLLVGLAAPDLRLRPGKGGELRSDLLSAFAPPSSPDLPLVAFAAIGPWPMPDGRTLEANGVQFASAEVRGAGPLEVTLTLSGPDRLKLRDFVSRELATELVERYPGLRKLTEPLARALDQASTPRVDTGWQLRVKAVVPLADVVSALDQLVPVPPAPQ